MNSFAIGFVLINSIMLIFLPRRLAPLPLLVGACYMTLASAVEVGAFHFMVIRILIAVGISRVILRGERLAGKMNTLDWLMVAWAVWALMSSLFHEDTAKVLVNHLGLAYNACGIYFLLRVFCQSLDEVVTVCVISAVLLVPLSIEMFLERMSGYNMFSTLGGVPAISEIRDGRIRAQGPFASSILAGTVGAVTLPLMIGLWQRHRKIAVAGLVACCIIIFASSSSGPIMSALWGIGALLMWHWHNQMRLVRWLIVFGYVGLDLIMKAPAYYLLARIDLTGSSTGWHRAVLIDTAFKHLPEWWFAGTDYTRHWLDYGAFWSPSHIDVTNHYLDMGVHGGLPLMFLFIAILAKGFSLVGQCLRQGAKLSPEFRFLVWSLGASLFSHATTCISISYFDQSVVFLYLTLAVVGSIWSCTILQAKVENAQENRIHISSAVSISSH
jgi:hypothetical protein